MSDDLFPERPLESDDSPNQHDSTDDLANPNDDFADAMPEPYFDQAPLSQENDNDFDIVFFPAEDPIQEEPFLFSPENETAREAPFSQEDIKILLPAWSESTNKMRAVAAASSPKEGIKKSSPWRGCLIGAVAGIIVFSLIASSLFSLYWFWNQRSDRVAEVSAMLNGHLGQQSAETENGGRPGVESGSEREQMMAPALASQSADPVNRVVFINEKRQIETISPDGSDRRQLTSDTKTYLFPAWSQDGRFIASIGTTINGAGIYVMPDEAQSTEIEEVNFSGSDSAFYLYWSPDSTQISFLANSVPHGLSLNVVDVDGESDSRIIAVGSPMYWNWAADSRSMLVHSGSDTADAQLGMLSSNGRPASTLVPAPGPFQAPGISANGRYWAYSQFQSGGTTWLVIDDRFSGEEASHRHAGSAAFTWNPVGNELAFISGAAQTELSSWGPLRLMDAQTGELRLLSSETVIGFFWSPDGRQIVTISIPDAGILGEQFQVRSEKGRHLARFAPGSAAMPAAQIPAHTFHINVIDVESGETRQLLETSLSTIFMTQFLPYFDQYALSHQIWSPDSTSFVLPIANGTSSEVTLIDAGSGQTTKLADGSIAFWSRQ